jgi:hypothetical protein
MDYLGILLVSQQWQYAVRLDVHLHNKQANCI